MQRLISSIPMHVVERHISFAHVKLGVSRVHAKYNTKSKHWLVEERHIQMLLTCVIWDNGQSAEAGQLGRTCVIFSRLPLGFSGASVSRTGCSCGRVGCDRPGGGGHMLECLEGGKG